MEQMDNANNSAGASTKQFATQMEGLEASINRLKSAAEGFYTSMSGTQNLFTSVIDFTAKLINMFSELGIKGTALLLVLGYLTAVLAIKVVATKMNTKADLAGVRALLKQAAAAWAAVAANLALYASIALIVVVIAAVVVGIAAAVTARERSIKKLKEEAQAHKENAAAAQSNTNSLDSIIKKYKAAYEAGEDLSEIQAELAQYDEDLANKIDLVNGSLEDNIALLKEEQKLQAQTYISNKFAEKKSTYEAGVKAAPDVIKDANIVQTYNPDDYETQAEYKSALREGYINSGQFYDDTIGGIDFAAVNKAVEEAIETGGMVSITPKGYTYRGKPYDTYEEANNVYLEDLKKDSELTAVEAATMFKDYLLLNDKDVDMTADFPYYAEQVKDLYSLIDTTAEDADSQLAEKTEAYLNSSLGKIDLNDASVDTLKQNASSIASVFDDSYYQTLLTKAEASTTELENIFGNTSINWDSLGESQKQNIIDAANNLGDSYTSAFAQVFEGLDEYPELQDAFAKVDFSNLDSMTYFMGEMQKAGVPQEVIDSYIKLGGGIKDFASDEITNQLANFTTDLELLNKAIDSDSGKGLNWTEAQELMKAYGLSITDLTFNEKGYYEVSQEAAQKALDAKKKEIASRLSNQLALVKEKTGIKDLKTNIEDLTTEEIKEEMQKLANQKATIDEAIQRKKNQKSTLEEKKAKIEETIASHENTIAQNENTIAVMDNDRIRGIYVDETYYEWLVNETETLKQNTAALKIQTGVIDKQIDGIDKTIGEYEEESVALGETIDAYGEYNTALGSTIDKTESATSATDAYKESLEEAADSAKRLADAQQRLIELQTEQAKKALEDYQEVLEKDQQAYQTNLTNKLTALKQYLEDQKEQLQKEQEQIKEANEAFADSVTEQNEALKLQADTIKTLYDERIKAIQDQISALDEQNAAEEKALEIQKAKDEYEKAKNNKTRLVLTAGAGWVFRNNATEVAEKKKAYQDKLDEKALEDQKEALQAQIDILNEEKDKWSEIADNIGKTTEEIEKATAAYELYNQQMENGTLSLDDFAKAVKENNANNSQVAINAEMEFNTDELDAQIEEVNDQLEKVGKSAEDLANEEEIANYQRQISDAVSSGQVSVDQLLAYAKQDTQNYTTYLKQYQQEIDMIEAYGKNLDDISEKIGKTTEELETMNRFYAAYSAQLSTDLAGFQTSINDISGAVDSLVILTDNAQIASARNEYYSNNSTMDGFDEWYAQNYSYRGYASGGINSFTGPAMLHGTASAPEMVLNNLQSRSLFDFINNLPTSTVGETNSTGFNNCSFNITTNANSFDNLVSDIKRKVPFR